MPLKKFLFLPFLILSLTSNICPMAGDTDSPSNKLQITLHTLFNQKYYHPFAKRNFIACLPLDIVDHIFIKISAGKEKPYMSALKDLGITSHYFAQLLQKFKLRCTTNIDLNKRILAEGKRHDVYGKDFSEIANQIIQTNVNHIILIENNQLSSLKDSPYFMPTFNHTFHQNHLSTACLALNATELEWLFNNGIDPIVNNCVPAPIVYCIYKYVQYDNEETNKKALSCVELILTKKGDVNIANNDGWTLLHKTFDSYSTDNARNALPLVKLLVKYKADANKIDKCGITPLHLATMNSISNKQETIRTLVQAGADPYLSIASSFIKMKSRYEGLNCFEIVRLKHTNDQGELTPKGQLLLNALTNGATIAQIN